MKSDGRIVLGWRAQRLLSMLWGLYDASVTGQISAPGERRLRLLLISLRRRQLKRQSFYAALALVAALALYLSGALPFWPAPAAGLAGLALAAANLVSMRRHSRALKNIPSTRRRLYAVK